MSNLLAGKNVVIVIFAPAYTRLHKALTAQGGHHKKTVTKKTDYVVSNGKACKELDRAHAFGIRIITQAQFEELLVGKPLQEPDDEVPEVGVNDAFGQVRSVLQDPSLTAKATWDKVVELLDACEPEALQALTHHVETYIAHGERDATYGGIFIPEPFDEDTFRFLGRAPNTWYAGLIEGERSPKYTLVRELNLLSAGFASNLVTRMLDHPDLTTLQRLCLPDEKSPTSGLIKRLCQHDSLDGLKSLGLPMIKEKVVEYFETHGQTPRALESLDLSSFEIPWKERPRVVELLGRLCRTPFVSTIDTLCLRNITGRGKATSMWLDDVVRPEVLPHLEHLHIGGWQMNAWSFLHHEILAHEGVRAHIRRLSCNAFWSATSPSSVDALRAFFDLDYSGRLERLDLSGMRPSTRDVTYHDRHTHEAMLAMHEALLEHMPKGQLLEHVDALHLGLWLTPELRDALSRTYPHLEVR